MAAALPIPNCRPCCNTYGYSGGSGGGGSGGGGAGGGSDFNAYDLNANLVVDNSEKLGNMTLAQVLDYNNHTNTPILSPLAESGSWNDLDDIPQEFNPGYHTQPVDTISDSSSVGRAMVTAANALAQRNVIGYGPSSSPKAESLHLASEGSVYIGSGTSNVVQLKQNLYQTSLELESKLLLNADGMIIDGHASRTAFYARNRYGFNEFDEVIGGEFEAWYDDTNYVSTGNYMGYALGFFGICHVSGNEDDPAIYENEVDLPEGTGGNCTRQFGVGGWNTRFLPGTTVDMSALRALTPQIMRGTVQRSSGLYIEAMEDPNPYPETWTTGIGALESFQIYSVGTAPSAFAGPLTPIVNGATASKLGTATKSWHSANFATNATIGFGNSNFTITHAAGQLQIGPVVFDLDDGFGYPALNIMGGAGATNGSINFAPFAGTGGADYLGGIFGSARQADGTSVLAWEISSNQTDNTTGAGSSQLYMNWRQGGVSKGVLGEGAAFSPIADNSLSLGRVDVRWNGIYLTAGSIVDIDAGQLSLGPVTIKTADGAGYPELSINGTAPGINGAIRFLPFAGTGGTDYLGGIFGSARQANGTLVEVWEFGGNQTDNTTGAGSSQLYMNWRQGGVSQGVLGESGSFSPIVDDGLALGKTSLRWSDLFLASGAVLNFANGDFLVTHAIGQLTLGPLVLDSDDGTGYPAINILGNTGGAGAAVNFVPAAGTGGTDFLGGIFGNSRQSDGTMVLAWEFASNQTSNTVGAGSSNLYMNWRQGGVSQGVIGENGAFSPIADDGVSLGKASLRWSDLHLATGALINVANGNAVITHSSAVFNVTTGDFRVTVAGTNSQSVVTVGGTQTLTGKTLSAEVYSTSAAVTAGTNAQGQGALTSDYNVITTAASSPSGATLPTATVGRRVTIVNKGANAVNVYPASGGQINALGANNPYSLAVDAKITFDASTTTQWY